MTFLDAIILGFIQGATEFLPVSSSGHLVIGQALLAVEIPGVLFEVAVHVATLVSIVLVYRTRVATLARGAVTGDRDALSYVGLVVVATIPAGLLGVFAKDAIEALFDNPWAPGAALLVTGTFLWTSRAALERAKDARPTWGGAFLIGIAQAFALVPGISRSGATVVAALWLGLEAREAAAFSFLMAVPAIAGAAVLQIPDILEGTSAGLAVPVVAAGSLVAAVTGVLAIRTFNAMLARRSFHFFAPYCWAVGALYLAFLALR
jgi:undecaprenyl-diphosphatase